MNHTKKVEHWDKMYQLPLEDIPWEIKEPPVELVKLIEKGTIPGGTALDIACGTGNYSFYLAKHGFEVTGVDFSKHAIALANKQAKTQKLPVKFLVGDITKIGQLLPPKCFDFILDYSILHHLETADLPAYIKQCTDLLKPSGKLLMVCYSEKDGFAQGKAATKGTFGNTMFYRTADEIRRFYKNLKELDYYESALGKSRHHPAHCFLFEKG